MKTLLLLLILLGLLAAFVFGILWIVSLFTYINQQPARLIRNTFIAMGVVILSSVGLVMTDWGRTETTQQRLAAENAELKDQMTGLQVKLTEVATENERLKTEQEELKSKSDTLRREYKKLQAEVAEYVAVAEQLAATKTILADEKEALLAKVTALTQQLAEAELENGLLLEEVAALETVISISEEPTVHSAAIPETEAAAAMADLPSVESFEGFANCTELKAVYPNGVSSDHAAYQPPMDRDRDGWACE